MKDHAIKLTIVGFAAMAIFGGSALAQSYDFLVRSEPINLLGQPTVNKDFAILSPPKVVNASQASGCQCGPDCPCAGAVQTVKNSRSKYRYVRYTDGSWKATPITNAVTVEEQPSSITVYEDDDEPSYGSSGSAYSGGYRTVYAPRSYYAPVARQSYTGSYYSGGTVRRGLFGGGRVFRAGGGCANGQCGF